MADDGSATAVDGQTSDVTMSDDEMEAHLADLLADMDDGEVTELADLAGDENVQRSRFARLSKALAAKGAHNPDALAAWIGRKKYGRAGMAALAAKGRLKRKVKSKLTRFRSPLDAVSVAELLRWLDLDGPDGTGQPASGEQSRSGEPAGPEILRYERTWALDDIVVRSGGDGRTVEAYAAVFDVPSEIRDTHGHYMEIIDRKAFNRAISHGIERVGVFYHHGMTLHGTPSDLGSVPIGSPVDIRPDGKGLHTVTRFNQGQFADQVLEAIRNGDIKGYSFRGRIFQSNPAKVPRVRGGSLPTITRTELGLTEYGPTPTPAYADAGILAVRSVEALAARFAALAPGERVELMRILSVATPQDPECATPQDPETDTATPDVGPGTEDSPAGRSGRKAKLAEILVRAKVPTMEK